jgi:MoaA/NifB/PqqE/SkfB family radical SAM enzyme
MYDNSMKALIMMARSRGIPLSGMFELTSKCNLRCGFCYVCDRGKQICEPPEKNTDEWLSMIRQAADMGLLRCAFTGGDPFMREDFEEIYCKAYDMGLRVSIYTNGILIKHRQRAYLKKRMPDLISISLYGASESTYRAVCGGGGNFHRTMESLDGLRGAGIAFELKVLAMRPLIDEYEKLGRIAVKYSCPGKFDPYICSGRDDRERKLLDWRIPPSQISDVMRRFQSQFAPENMSLAEDRTVSFDGVFQCGAGKDTFIITYDGRMLGCPSLTCFDTYPFREGFETAWNTLKNMINNADACPECADCIAQNRCFICPANRLCETGSIVKCNSYLKELAFCMAAIKEEALG